MKITYIFILLALSGIAWGQWAAAARNFYQPILLSFGAAFSFMASDKVETDSFKWNDWITNMFSKKLIQPRDGVLMTEEPWAERFKNDRLSKRPLKQKDLDRWESEAKCPNQSKEDLVKEITEKMEAGSQSEDYKKMVLEDIDKLDKDQLERMKKNLESIGDFKVISMGRDDIEDYISNSNFQNFNF